MLLARLMPSCSIKSSLSRIPAVSTNFNIIPFKLIWVLIKSRVVPGISVTIEVSSLVKQFNKLDLPTFGAPNITVSTPSANKTPWFTRSRIFCILLRSSSTLASTLCELKKSISSSGKSSAASTNTRKAINSCCRL